LQLASGNAPALLDWNNNYGSNLNKCVCTHCSNFPRSFVANEVEISELDILGATIGQDKCFGAIKGHVASGDFTFFRVSTDDREGSIKSYVGEGKFTDDPFPMDGGIAVTEVKNLQKTMKNVNQSREYILEFNELLKTIPCPVPSIAGFGNFLAMVTRGGTDDAVKATKWLRDSALENIKDGIAGVPDEKIRIAWPYTHVFFDADLLTWLEETFKAVVIMDILGYYQVLPHDTSTPEKCYESLAKGTLDFSMVGTCRGPIEFYIEFLLNYVKDYKIDCVIIPMQFACKHAYAIARVASEAVREQTGVPVLIFGCDPYDSREVTSDAIRERISEFLTQVVL